MYVATPYENPDPALHVANLSARDGRVTVNTHERHGLQDGDCVGKPVPSKCTDKLASTFAADGMALVLSLWKDNATKLGIADKIRTSADASNAVVRDIGRVSGSCTTELDGVSVSGRCVLADEMVEGAGVCGVLYPVPFWGDQPRRAAIDQARAFAHARRFPLRARG